MNLWEKSVKCAKCGNEITIKSFRLNPGKYKLGTGYVCPECLNKEKQEEQKPSEEVQA